ncbi:MAG TPA: ABC transporter ATP-binding protein [Candidatus Dormibacteraeota bacterium]
MSGGALLEVDALRTHFLTGRGAVRAVDGVSLAVERGRTLGVVGESGSGKTVLARSIMGLLPTTNVRREGRVTFDGRELTGMSPAELREIWGAELSMVFQDPMTSLNPVVRIGRQITETMRFHLGIRESEARARAVELLRSVGIPDPERRLREHPHQLSGGMRQRVTIAIALACGPRMLLADEPTTALDVTVQAQILNLLGRQQRELHMAMVLVTHDLGVVAGRTDDIAVMYAGRIVELAPTAVLFSDMRMRYTQALFRSIPRVTDPGHRRLVAIGGRPPDLAARAPGCSFAPRCRYARDRCWAETPPLADAGPGHQFACWYPVEAGEAEADAASAPLSATADGRRI